jgi:hypothetical protein
MTRATFLVGIAFSITACGRGEPTDALARLADEACACATRACAEAANSKRESAFESYSAALGGKEPDAATAKKFDEHMRRLASCLVEHIPLDKLQ